MSAEPRRGEAPPAAIYEAPDRSSRCIDACNRVGDDTLADAAAVATRRPNFNE
jgi:hypothetical protein